MTQEELCVKFGVNGYIRHGFGLLHNDPEEIKKNFYKGDYEKVKEWLKKQGRDVIY